MKEMEKVVQEETFEIEVQYCDPDDCLHDWGLKEMEKVVQEETFEIEVQYCDPNDCLHDCIHSGVNNCDAIITGWR